MSPIRPSVRRAPTKDAFVYGGPYIPYGFPDAFNTGPRTVLTLNVPGDVTSGTGWYWEEAQTSVYVNGAGATFDGYNVAGGIVVLDTAIGATVSNCVAVIIWVDANTTAVTVEHNRVNANHLYGHAAIKFLTGTTNGIIRYNDISNSENGIRVQGAGTQVYGNYIHDLIDYDVANDPHIDGIEINAANCTVTGNTIIANSLGANAAVTMDASTGCVIDGNYMLGGGYVARIYFHETTELTNNLIGPGVFGHYSSDSGGTGYPLIHDNIDALTGVPIQYDPAEGMDHATAWAGNSVNLLRNWFELNTGPRVPVTTIYTGDYNVNSQADATALSGVTVRGRILFNVGNVTAVDFALEWDGSGTGKNLLQSTSGVSNVTLQHFLIDGRYGNISYGITGTSFSDSWTVTNGEIKRCGGDGVRSFANSTYDTLYLHDFRPWNEAVDGPWVPNGDQNFYPHTDGFQAVRSDNDVIRCWVENTGASNSTAAFTLKSDAAAITGFSITDTYVDGGGVILYVDNQNASLDNPGAFGNPTGIVLNNVRVGRTYRDSVYRLEVPYANVTRTNVVYADTGAAVPDQFVDDFNRANENIEAGSYWDRVSGAAGNLTVDTNAVRSTSTTQTTALIKTTLPVSTTDHFAECNWKASASNTGWIIVRYADENNYVGMQINSLVPTLYTRIAGTFTARVTGSAYSAGDKIRVAAVGQIISLYRNGTLVGSYDMGAGVLTSGRVGLQGRSTVANPMCDNFRAGTLPA